MSFAWYQIGNGLVCYCFEVFWVLEIKAVSRIVLCIKWDLMLHTRYIRFYNSKKQFLQSRDRLVAIPTPDMYWETIYNFIPYTDSSGIHSRIRFITLTLLFNVKIQQPNKWNSHFASQTSFADWKMSKCSSTVYIKLWSGAFYFLVPNYICLWWRIRVETSNTPT